MNTTNMPEAADKQATKDALTDWYESQRAEDNNPSWHEFKAVNDASHEPLDKEALLSLWNALTRERSLGGMGRTLLSDALQSGVPEPEELERDILIKVPLTRYSPGLVTARLGLHSG